MAKRAEISGKTRQCVMVQDKTTILQSRKEGPPSLQCQQPMFIGRLEVVFTKTVEICADSLLESNLKLNATGDYHVIG